MTESIASVTRTWAEVSDLSTIEGCRTVPENVKSTSKASSQTARANAAADEFLQDVLLGLSADDKYLSSKYFYDQRGSELFEKICELKEYYPTRTELAMLPGVAAEVADKAPDIDDIVEFGSGNCRKVELMLEQLPDVRRYVPIDVSDTFLLQHSQRLQKNHKDLHIEPVVGDFTEPLELPPARGRRLGFFPGSTIGNLSHAQARSFLEHAAQTLGTGNYLLIGVDTLKSEDVLIPAYADEQGITSAFNLNLLARMQRELGARVSLEKFQHEARFNQVHSRIEMHLRSLEKQIIHIGEQAFHLEEGETIHTENSHKYSPSQFIELAYTAGWLCEEQWLAPDDMFALYLLRC